MDKKTVLGTFTMSAVVFMVMLFVPSGLYGRDKEDQATIPFRYEDYYLYWRIVCGRCCGACKDFTELSLA